MANLTIYYNNQSGGAIPPIGGNMKRLVEKFQCVGCLHGGDTNCGSYNYDPNDKRCVSHVCGTQFGLGNIIALGLPKGFNKPGFDKDGRAINQIDIRLWKKGDCFDWDHLNVPVWALEREGFLFVRTFAPRINCTWIDVIECGSLSLCPSAINVAKFIDEID